ncbi:ABC transporter substrate-binding protein [Kitasatospora aureofaciens]|uniref:ABC transporter substrate-binding protein n=1 Tax=Kitasatospora aureofaciens TaxID=1894 RepID=UPI0037CA94FA
MSPTRRDLLRSAGWALGLAGAGALISACGGGSTGRVVEQTASSTPRRGGTFRAVLTGGGAAESLDPFAGGSPSDYVRNDVIYESLFTLHDGKPAPLLALSAEPAPDARSFVLRLRDGVLWHDGSPFTAADVAYSLRYMSDPARPYPSELSSYLDAQGVSVTDDRTLRVPTRRPVGDPAVMLAAFPAKIIKNGAADFAPTSAIGTGPYRVEAFEAGREARLARFDRYWDGAPLADSVVLSSLADPQAKVNAVLTGQADFAADIPYTAARTGTSDSTLEIRRTDARHRTGFGFVLNATRPPFDDPRARRAIRLGVDRKALVDTVLLGNGSPGNDLFGAGSEYFAQREPVARNVDEARRLVKESGAGGAEIRIRSAEWEIGYNASTQLFAEQMREIGLNVKPEIVSVPTFFDVKALSEAHGIVFSIGALPLPVIYGRMAAYPSLAMPDDAITKAVSAAIGDTDETRRRSSWSEVQDAMFDRGNTVVWGLADTLSVARKNVAGIETRTDAKYPYLGKAGLA